MNFVIFSLGFYPHKGAESYCTTRFASALAKAGHNVHVVTVGRDPQDFVNSYDVLVHPNLKVTRVAAVRSRRCWPDVNLRWLTVGDPDVATLPAYIRVLRQVLKATDHPILISRSLPISCLYAAWSCRKLADRWVVHISDPIPWTTYDTKLVRLQNCFLRFWLRRAFSHADLISVTCERVRRFFRETVGSVVDQRPWTVTPHIGDNKLDAQFATALAHEIAVGVIVHSGDVYYGRGVQIVAAVDRLNEQGVRCSFVQDRPVRDERTRLQIASSGHCHVVGSEGDDEWKDRARRAQVSFVSDFNTDLPYSPFLMSKFVYQVYGDKPIVVFAKKDSAKHDYCERYPEAGLFFADMDEPHSLEVALKAALQADRTTFDRTAIRAHFSEDEVARVFLEKLTAVVG